MGRKWNNIKEKSPKDKIQVEFMPNSAKKYM